jgi:hypothetical protein
MAPVHVTPVPPPDDRPGNATFCRLRVLHAANAKHDQIFPMPVCMLGGTSEVAGTFRPHRPVYPGARLLLWLA